MAADRIKVNPVIQDLGQGVSYPTQAPSKKALLYEGLDSVDTVTGNFDAETTIVNGTTGQHKHVFGVIGTLMSLVVHHAATGVATSPVFNVFGKIAGIWQRLYTIEDTPAIDITCTVTTTDAETGAATGIFVTSVSSKAQTVDLRGATEVAVALKTAASITGTEADMDLYGYFF